jgi:hypothetical protein
MRTFKRDNWTTKQILKFIDGQKIAQGSGIECDYSKSHNIVVDDVIYFIKDQGRCDDYVWTNDEVINLLSGMRLNDVLDYAAVYNDTIGDIICYFYDFTRPVEEFGAVGYCVKEDMVYHIGGVPKEFAKQWKEDRVEL